MVRVSQGSWLSLYTKFGVLIFRFPLFQDSSLILYCHWLPHASFSGFPTRKQDFLSVLVGLCSFNYSFPLGHFLPLSLLLFPPPLSLRHTHAHTSGNSLSASLLPPNFDSSPKTISVRLPENLRWLWFCFLSFPPHKVYYISCYQWKGWFFSLHVNFLSIKLYLGF